MKITATTTNNLFLDLLSSNQKIQLSTLTETNSISAITTILLQNKSASDSFYVEQWAVATTDSVEVKGWLSITLSKVDLSQINILWTANVGISILVSRQ